jgi:hypothetical protein
LKFVKDKENKEKFENDNIGKSERAKANKN